MTHLPRIVDLVTMTISTHQSSLLRGNAFINHDVLDELFDLKRMFRLNMADNVTVGTVSRETRRTLESTNERRLRLLLLRVLQLYVLLLR